MVVVPRSDLSSYSWRSYATAGAVIVWDQHEDTTSVKLVLAQAIQETNRLRKYTVYGNFWRLTEMTLDETVWMAYQYHLPDEDSGIVFFFRRIMSPYTDLQVFLFMT